MRDESATLRDEDARRRDEFADLRDVESDRRERVTRPSGGPDRDPGVGKSRDRADETREETAPRDCSAEGKDRIANRHDADAEDRDKQAHDRDEEADDRDEAADQRDQAARDLERSQDIVTVDDARSRAEALKARTDAASDRRHAKQDRLRAAEERTAAGVDRDASAVERTASASDRRHAKQDRGASATDRAAATQELDAASLDALTGTYSRGAGMAELERDFSRAKRTGEPLTLAFVDVDDLKGVNDRDGHPAGDQLIRQVAEVLTAHTRPHDVIIRYGGDEFVCALMGLTLTDAADRLDTVNLALAEASQRGSITVGLAELETGESLSSLIRRADEALYLHRRQR